MIRVKNQVKIFDSGTKNYDGIYSLKNTMFNTSINSINKEKVLELIDNYNSPDGVKEIYDLDCCVIKTEDLKIILHDLEAMYSSYTDSYGSNPEVENTINYIKKYVKEEE